MTIEKLKWIPVEKELPMPRHVVLIWVCENRLFANFWSTGYLEDGKWLYDDSLQYADTVTHWAEPNGPGV
jgi:hypothetical protein